MKFLLNGTWGRDLLAIAAGRWREVHWTTRQGMLNKGLTDARDSPRLTDMGREQLAAYCARESGSDPAAGEWQAGYEAGFYAARDAAARLAAEPLKPIPIPPGGGTFTFPPKPEDTLSGKIRALEPHAVLRGEPGRGESGREGEEP